MSRIGKKPITIPSGVTVTYGNNTVTVKGPKGTLTRILPASVSLIVSPTEVTVAIADETDRQQKALWGTWGSHVTNMVTGVTTGFSKQLEINGVGYRAAMQGNGLKLEVGYSHPVIFSLPTGISATVEKNVITLNGFDKELLGKVASELRSVRKPEPYKGKGIKYMDETIRRKAGKAAKSAA
jgi:large subunit ribosomal protein L6